MDVREKLVELLDIIIQPGQKTLGDISDHLIAHGVTVQEWISVKDRLPDNEKPVLAHYGFYREKDDLGARFIGTLTYFSHDPDPHWQHESTGLFVTHWMPLPEPPKEEQAWHCLGKH